MLNRIILHIIIISSLSFFTLTVVPEGIIKQFEFISPMIMAILLFIYSIYDTSLKFKKNFQYEIILLFVAVFLSMFGAKYFHMQGFKITLISQRYMYFLLFYYFLHSIKINPKELIQLVIIFSLLYSFLYLLQTALYPTPITSSDMFLSRGTIRIFIPGSAYLILAYLFSYVQFLNTLKIKYILFCLLGILIFILLGTRQVIAVMALLTIIATFKSKYAETKAMGIALIVISIIPAYFLFKDIFIAMLEVSQKQAGNLEQNIRVKAAIFFLFEFFPNRMSYIIGNGVPSAHSIYGIRINEYKDIFGFFQSDIGLIGEFSKFGLLFAIAELIILFKILFMKLHRDLFFIKLFIIGVMLTLFTGKGIFGGADNIVIVCLMLYLIDVYKDPQYQALYITEESTEKQDVLTES
jgi:hypothetical protein